MSGQQTRVSALVRGRVQGVGYRMFALERARARGLAGYVRNLADGRTVEIVAEGPRGDLEEMVRELRRGPQAARVEQVDETWGPSTGDLAPFAVRP